MEYIEAQRQYQNALERHRVDPDDEGSYQDLLDAAKVRDEAWSIQNVAKLVRF